MSRSIYTVSSLVHYLKESIEHDVNVQSILIKGEISNFTNHRSGHWYFTLKDAKSKLSCVMFASYASRCKILLKEGMQVIVNASLSVYEAQGNVQLYVTKVQVDGLGDLYLQYEQLKQKLSMEGLFDPAHKKPLPNYPEHIVLISAKEGAALQDMLNTLSRRWPIAKVTFLPSLVQGKDAANYLIENLIKADELHPDVILLARGGGPIEDLWCFNDEKLARCIYACNSVVVSGVGHETDTTLVDYVSDARAATPTAAAELVTPDIQEVSHILHVQRQRMEQAINRRLQEAKSSMHRIHMNRYLKDPLLYIQDAQLRLAMHIRELETLTHRVDGTKAQVYSLAQRLMLGAKELERTSREDWNAHSTSLRHAITLYKNEQQKRLGTQASLLDAYSPLKILSRGYGVVYEQQHILKSIHDVKEHDEITVRMQDGTLCAMVTKKEELS